MVVYSTQMVLEHTSDNLIKILFSPCVDMQQLTKTEAKGDWGIDTGPDTPNKQVNSAGSFYGIDGTDDLI